MASLPPRGPLVDLTESRQQGVANRRWSPQCTLGDRWKPRWMWSVRGLPMSAVALWITKWAMTRTYLGLYPIHWTTSEDNVAWVWGECRTSNSFGVR